MSAGLIVNISYGYADYPVSPVPPFEKERSAYGLTIPLLSPPPVMEFTAGPRKLLMALLNCCSALLLILMSLPIRRGFELFLRLCPGSRLLF